MKILWIFILYSLSIIVSELSLGNPNFPFPLWTFVKIPTWQWSIPVHLFGFLWIVFWNSLLNDKPAGLVILISTLFFFVAESLNWYLFHFFIYSKYPFGEVFSFFAVIMLYIILSSACVFLLRK